MDYLIKNIGIDHLKVTIYIPDKFRVCAGTVCMGKTKGPGVVYLYLLMVDGYEHAVWPMQ